MTENDTQKKVYVLDTSVLVHDPEAIEKFGDNIVVVHICVVEELDHLKKNRDEKGSNSRTASRKLDAYRKLGSLKEGVKTKNGGMIFIDYGGGSFELLPIGLEATNDNRVILVAKKWREEKNYKNVVVVSKDVNLRLKADACGIPAEDYRADKYVDDVVQHSGVKEIELKAEQADFLDKINIEKSLKVAILSGSPNLEELLPNQCCKFNFGNKCALAIYKKESKEFRLVRKPKDFSEKGIKPINMEQAFAYALLSDPQIRLVALAGPARTGKTLISLLAGYEQLGKTYSQLLIYRPNIEIGQPLGFLPGDINEKFAPWMQPIFDNLSLILEKGDQRCASKISKRGKSRAEEEGLDKCFEMNGESGEFDTIKSMMFAHILDIAPIAYMRGRSLRNKFVIIDEAQNMTPHEIKTILTRPAKNIKMVLTGDITQIDNPYVDSISNGLSHVIEKLKGQELVGHVFLQKGEGDPLAELATRLL